MSLPVAVAPTPSPADASVPIDLPEELGYHAKVALLGQPLTNDAAEHERLSKRLALGVLSSDCISSSAYGSEQILLVLLPLFGMAAYDLLMPLTLVVLVVLAIVTMTYRQVVLIYTKAGGSYVVARDNYGPVVAQVAAVALMLDYIVTVAVQAAAGTDTLTSAFPGLADFSLWITVTVVCVLCYGNLRGIREAGRAFAFPTYFFIGSMAVVLILGSYHVVRGDLPTYDPITAQGAYAVGQGSPLLTVGAVYVLLQAFANGGSSLTGLEAISNGVSIFRPPAGRNARTTLVTMSVILGVLVGGVSWLAHLTHAVPYESGSPTVISQVARAVFPDNGIGHVLFFLVQAATMLILYTGANTPFTGFPFLANFVAADGFLPRWLRKRGHRLAFSNGILLLAVIALALILGTGAHVNRLVAFYAIGVFTGFTFAGFGMARYARQHTVPNPVRSRIVNTLTGVVAAAVVVIFAVTKFTEGAWLVVVVFPLLVVVLLRLHRAYVREAALLAHEPSTPVGARVGLNVVLVLIDTMDLAVVRTLRYARSLRPAQLHCVHVVTDPERARELAEAWESMEGGDLTLELVDCPDRRLERTALAVTRRLVDSNPLAQVTVLLPRRAYGRFTGRLLHDHTADRIARAVSRLPGAAATIVPFDASAAQRYARLVEPRADAWSAPARSSIRLAPSAALPAGVDGGVASAAERAVATVHGRVIATRLSAVAASPSYAVELADRTGHIQLLFYGRRRVHGIDPGVELVATGRVADLRGRRTIANPRYRIVAHADPPER
ncbi:MAG TPA: amino acid permease [Dermatophilaceae bacterium]|nr:amino acid permease [Dermatophilaceae bacterium]